MMDQKKYAEACPKFEASYKADPATGTKLNLAECHEKEGKLARAWAEWGEARDQAKRENDTKRVDLAMRRQKELDPRVPKLTIRPVSASGCSRRSRRTSSTADANGRRRDLWRS